MGSDTRVFVAGHRGMVGSAITRCLTGRGYKNIVVRTRGELDLSCQASVDEFFRSETIDHVYLAAARVGGILANATYPAEFIHENLAIQTNVIHSAWAHGVRKLLFLGSSCIYPRLAPQPIREVSLLTGPLESTNEWYAVAKIAGVKMCQAYRRQYGFDAICPMPTNLYGPNDNFDHNTSHVVPGLIRRFHDTKQHGAREVVIWGTGTVRREFMHVDDLADACVFLMERYSSEEVINVGVGADITILELAELIGRTLACNARITSDPSKPDGTPRKLLDVSRMGALGWRARISLESGIASTYQWFLDNKEKRAASVNRGLDR